MCDTINVAEASAIIYSLVETAKANKLKIYEYFNHLLTEIPEHMQDKNRDFLINSCHGQMNCQQNVENKKCRSLSDCSLWEYPLRSVYVRLQRTQFSKS